MSTRFYKDPSATLDYGIDWGDWLDTNPGGVADTIASTTWTVPTGLTKVSDNVTGDKAIIWLSGGNNGASYEVTCRVTTTAGRVDERTITIVARNT